MLTNEEGLPCAQKFASSVPSPDTTPATTVVQEQGEGALYAPEQISGLVLEELRRVAEQHFGPDMVVEDVVVTVPAYFNDDQRQVRDCALQS